jgi:hypothetical protein
MDGGDASVDAMQCMNTGATPMPRAESVGVVDPMTGALYVVGGDQGSTEMCMPRPMFTAEVWRYEPECIRWTLLNVDSGPTPRSRAASALDTHRRRLLMFGGRFRSGASGAYTLYDETWALDLAQTQWTRVDTSGPGPSARANASAVYDEARDRLVVFGGNTSTDPLRFTPQNDTWALDLGTGTWSRLGATSAAPPARQFHAAAAGNGTMVIVSGGDANAFTGPFLHDAWSFDLAMNAWTELPLSGDDPLGRINHAIVFDSSRSRFILLAGHDDGDLGNRNDAMELASDGTVRSLVAGDTFNQPGAGFCDFPSDFTVADANAPERRSAMVAALDASHDRVIVFGGRTDCGSTNDVWSFDLAMNRWSPLQTSNEGVSCARAGRTDCTALCF